MPSKIAKPLTCPCCNQEIGENFVNHKSSPEHRFNFYIWAFETKRKRLAKDKDGIRLEVEVENTSNLGLQLVYDNKTKHIIEVKPEHLHSLKNILLFRCCVFNDRKEDDMFLTAAGVLDASPFSFCYDDKEDWMGSEKYIAIKPKECYRGVLIKFKIDTLVVGSYKIPFAFNLQSEDGNVTVTLCRTIVVTIVDLKEASEPHEGKKKSPFTDKLWENVKTIVRPFHKMNLTHFYPVPHKSGKCFNYGFKDWKGISIQEFEALEALKRQMEPGHLTKENYKNFLHNCLWLEEKVNTLMLHSYNMENVTMTVCGQNDLKLEVPGLAEKRPSLINGDLIRVRLQGDHTVYEGYIRRVENTHIVIKYLDIDIVATIESNPKLEMDVAFQLGRLPLERAHAGIDKVCKKGIINLLFPDLMQFPTYKKIYNIADSEFRNQNIVSNPEQKIAVEKILNSSSRGAPYIVFGPPGTGKTVTIVEAICQILKQTKKRILVCAPANAACDMLTSKLIRYCNKKELIRIHSDTRDKSTITKEVRGYSNMTSEGHVLPVHAKDLMKYRIVVATLIFIGRFNGGDYYPDCLFIDEAAQAMETDACVALGLMRHGSTIVLAGDPKQLGPVVQSTVAQKFGLNTSLLERLMETQKIYNCDDEDPDPNFITMLKKHFRSHPDILQIPNDLFYNSKLCAASSQPEADPVAKLDIYPNIKKLNPSIRKVKLGTGRALEFCAVSAQERREGRSPSYFNPAEANMVIEYVKTLINVQLGTQDKVKPSDIGVITPYIRQVYKIKELLNANRLDDVEVGSTEAFQGREKRIIIISTVRAQDDLLKYDKKYTLGFVKQAKRFNVAISRAISKVVVIGCPSVLATDEKWHSYMKRCQDLNTYHGAPYEERTTDKMMEIINRFKLFPNFERKEIV